MIGLLLAAGSARRFGGPKLLATLPDGTPLALAAARNLRPAVDALLVAIRPDDGALRQLLQQGGYPAWPCREAHLGMGHTLAELVRALPLALPGHAEAAVLVALADMPLVAPATLQAVADALRAGAPLARPVWAGQPGHPVGFAASYRPALTRLQGDEGARTLIRQAGVPVTLLSCNDPGVLLDVDTPEALAALPVPPSHSH